MSWWTDVRDQTLNNLGVDTGAATANTVGSLLSDAAKSPAASPPSPPAQTVANVASVSAPTKTILGLSIPVAIAAALAVYLLVIRKRG